jgi:hypothetical protein
MADDVSPFADDESTAAEMLQGLISPAPAQALVYPPPDTPPPTRAGESTPVTGSLATPPSQAKPKMAPDDASPKTGTVRRGLAALFSGRTEQIARALDLSSNPDYVKVESNGQVGYLPKANLKLAQQRDRNLKVLR